MQQPDRLSIKQRAVLIALLAEARELANPELEKRVGFRLDGRDRRLLNDRKLVDSRRAGRAYAHELSDGGWKWCRGELAAGPDTNSGSMERALYAVLAGLGRHLDSTDQGLNDVFAPIDRTAGADNVDVRVSEGYRALARKPGDFVKLAELRGRISDVPRSTLDGTLGTMYRTQRINLVPQSNQRALTEADRESALRIGGEFKHLISIEKP